MNLKQKFENLLDLTNVFIGFWKFKARVRLNALDTIRASFSFPI